MTRPALSFALAACMTLAAAACLQDFEQFRGGGTGGFGGSATTTTTTTATSTSSGMQCIDENCPGDDTDCGTPGCGTTGMCSIIAEPAGTACDDGTAGSKVCNGAGTCVECNTMADCMAPTPICSSNICVAEHCQNMMPDPNLGETDVDCGGMDCAPCINGQGCMTATDCTSGFCNGTTCEACTGDGNCDATQYCDTGAGTCTIKKAVGLACGGNNECENGQCVDGVCCGSASCSDCQSCNIGGSEGTCSNDPVGTPCNDGLFCTMTDTCDAGTCSGTGNPCPGADGDGDCSEACNEAADMCNGNDPNGSACNDGLFCTMTDTCNNGSCTGAGDPCPGPDGDGDCSESCDETNNNCNGNDTNGSACNDGMFCTMTDTCTNGSCGGTGNPCPGPDGDNDCSESCDETNNNCNGNDTNGSACNDGQFCTQTDTCTGGTCGGTGNPCPGEDTGPSCNDSCDETLNNCTANDVDGTMCNPPGNGTCTAGSCG